MSYIQQKFLYERKNNIYSFVQLHKTMKLAIFRVYYEYFINFNELAFFLPIQKLQPLQNVLAFVTLIKKLNNYYQDLTLRNPNLLNFL